MSVFDFSTAESSIANLACLLAILFGFMLFLKKVHDALFGDDVDYSFRKISSPTFRKNKSKRFAGVEIECIRQGLLEVSKLEAGKYHFSKSYDGSLSSSGVEFSSQPSQGDKLLEIVSNFCGVLNKNKYDTNTTCGLHIHLEQKPDIKMLQKILLFYHKYEDLFFDMLPNSRRDNSYCIRFKKILSSDDIIKMLITKNCMDFKRIFYETTDPSKYTSTKSNDKRYCWANFHSIFYRGTLEIRAHSGTVNSEKINKWLLIHLRVLDYLKDSSISKISRLKADKKTFLKLFNDDLSEYIQKRWNTFSDNKNGERNLEFQEVQNV